MKNLAGLAPLPKFREDKSADTRCTILKRLCVYRCMVMGFTLVEMMVTMGVMAAVVTMMFFNYSGFNRGIMINRAARALAYVLRDAQSRSVNVSQLTACNPSPCSNFGVYINKTSPKNGEIILFTDRDANGRYDATGTCGGGTDECVTKTLFTNGVTVSDLRAPPLSATHDAFNVLFYRPDPTVKIKNDIVGAPPLSDGVVGPFRIFIKHPSVSVNCSIDPLTPTPDCKTIRIWLTGQISIEQ